MRQKYQILIEDKNGVWKELDLGNDKLVWTYQVNDIAELVNRQASYSQNLRLPKTANNVNIFDHANNLDVVTDFPYRKHNCRVFCADRTIAGKGSFLILLKVTDHFECQVLSGNANFFETLQDSPMSDLDLGIFQICNASMNPSKWHPAYKIVYGLDIVLPSYPYSESSGYLYLNGVGSKYPVMSIDYILQQIISKQGYTFETNIDNWGNKYLSIDSADIVPTEDDLTIFDGAAETTGIETNSSGEKQFIWEITENADSMLSVSSHKNASALQIVLNGPQTVNFTVTSNPSIGDVIDVPIGTIYIVDQKGVIVYSHPFMFTPEQQTYTFPHENKRGNPAFTIYATLKGDPINGIGFSIKIGDRSDMHPSNSGGKLVMSERTGFETQFDFIKFFAQAFGLTFVVNEITKNVYAFTLQLLYDNIKSGKVKNWSDKVDRNPKSSLNFTLRQYAQENIISLEENSKDEFTDTGKFHLDNKTLQFSKELFKIAIGSGKDVFVTNGEVKELSAGIPLVELKPPSGLEEGQTASYQYYLFNASFPTIKPHLVELTDRTVNISFIGGAFDYHIANHITAQQIVDMGYSILQDKMLKNAKIVEDNFYLTPEDVEQFDPSIPVYIDKYGAYFYVNKIRYFELGKLTTCELVRL